MQILIPEDEHNSHLGRSSNSSTRPPEKCSFPGAASMFDESTHVIIAVIWHSHLGLTVADIRTYLVFSRWRVPPRPAHMHSIIADLVKGHSREVAHNIRQEVVGRVANFIQQLLSNRCLGNQAACIWRFGNEELSIFPTFNDRKTYVVLVT